jgi:hypothetical protein
MSMTDVIMAAVRVAKEAAGDLVVKAMLRHKTGQTYDTATSKYVPSYDDTEVELVRDKFTFVEERDPTYQTTDMKILVFNPTNELDITTADRFTIDEVEYSVKRVLPTYVGGYKPVIGLVLQK